MFKRPRYCIALGMLVFSLTQAMAQVAMPDTVCVGTIRLYHVNDPTIPSTYTWKINGVTQTTTQNEISITWNTAGLFLITVQEHSANGCDGDIRSGSVYVIPQPAANAGPDATICFGTSIRLNGSGGTVYQWSPATYLSDPGVSNPMANIPVAGIHKYYLMVSSGNGCKSLTDTVVITVLPPAKVFAGNDTSVAINQPLQLNAIDMNNSEFINYSWSPSLGLSNPSINNPVSILDRSITYIVVARTRDGCEARDDINIKVFQQPELYVPTGFTPNGDGLNDVLKVIPAGIRELKYFNIYNRWGELVFSTSNPAIGWNGVYKGQKQDGDVFVWTAEGIDYNGNIIKRKGTAVLIR